MSLAKALESRYPAPAWALFHEVANGTGHSWTRHADAIAMSIWPSRGLEVHGLEFKASRNDWLRELKDPKKAEDMVRYCDFWWLVTTNDDVAHMDEIPTEWGWLTLKGCKLMLKKAAPKREAAQLDKGFVAAVLRKAYDLANNEKRIQDKIDASYKRGYDACQAQADRKAGYAQEKLDDQLKAIREFEQASGLRIAPWDAGQIGAAVKAYMVLEHRKYKERLTAVAREFSGVAQLIEEQLKEIPE